MATDTRKYPKLIVKTQESAADLAGSIERSKSVSNKNFFYLIAFGITLIFAIVVAIIGSLDEATLATLARLLDSVPYLDLELSREIVDELKFPGTVSNTLFAGNFCFLAFILFDIFQSQEKLRQEDDLFKESSSVSYAIHIAILLWIMITVLVSYKPRPQVQVSRIEFVAQGTPAKRLTKSKRKSTKSSKDSGKHDPKKAVTPPSKPKGKPSLPPAKPVKQKKPPAPKSKPRPKPKSVTKPSPKPKARPPRLSKPKPSPKTLIPRPKVLREAIKQSNQVNKQSKALPKLLDYSPNSDIAAGRSSPSPSPSPVSSEHSNGPVSRNTNLVARLSSIPRAPDILAGTGAGGGLGADANAAPNKNPRGPVSIGASASINFGPYMSALQRKVKMSWKPPRGTESNRIIAKFTINPDGTLSDLVLVQKSVFPDANIAAMEAITKSSPFGFLPEGATEPIEIEFSFDYTTSQRIRY
ncbi:MAG: energy transducer TonB [Candidatus Melainabacteria bacterium]|nr:energy transducer TonB [Candidatus Melainabacteria bacterium]